MNRPVRPRKRIRLDLATYAVPGLVWQVTVGTRERQPVLGDPWIAETVIESIIFQCAKAKAELLIFCVMPEHVHLVIVVGEEGDLISILHDFKSFTTNRWRKRTGQNKLWQESFHDHGVRRSERMDELVAYVLQNPVDAGLATDWQDYPWIGGSLIDDNRANPVS
ncbi:MAG TPA: transposase [Thermomicrobiales bacterium]|nr:transposase [Thermomicrobiales bacterium]